MARQRGVVGASMSKPVDKILCQRKFYRYVIACMHNCPLPHKCSEFWSFFDAKGISPAEYFNENGIGDKVMRRVVFDCDRCGKKDISELYGAYTREGETPEHRLGPEQRAEAARKVGYAGDHVTHITFGVVGLLEETRKWQHYCKKCFQKVADSVAGILEEKRSASYRGDEDARDEKPAETRFALPIAVRKPPAPPLVAPVVAVRKPPAPPLVAPVVVEATLHEAPVRPQAEARPARRGAKPARASRLPASQPPASQPAASKPPAEIPAAAKGKPKGKAGARSGDAASGKGEPKAGAGASAKAEPKTAALGPAPMPEGPPRKRPGRHHRPTIAPGILPLGKR